MNNTVKGNLPGSCNKGNVNKCLIMLIFIFLFTVQVYTLKVRYHLDRNTKNRISKGADKGYSGQMFI